MVADEVTVNVKEVIEPIVEVKDIVNLQVTFAGKVILVVEGVVDAAVLVIAEGVAANIVEVAAAIVVAKVVDVDGLSVISMEEVVIVL